MSKNKIAAVLLMCSFILTSCGESKSENYNYAAVDSITADNAGYESNESYEAEEYNSGDNSGIITDAAGIEKSVQNTSEEVINQEMLVYTCDMSLEVLDFDEAMNKFKNSIKAYKGIVETENYSDGGNGSKWYDEKENKWQTYTATIRIPSADYDKFCSETSGIGNLRSKNATVDNLSQEYSDLSTTLNIYEAKEKRYLELLKTVNDDSYALKIENELTDIQISISKIKTRMKDIKTDVAYSYVNITINEVKKYTETPVEEKEDTFGERFSNNVSRSVKAFLGFLETLLYIIIYLLPYIVLLGLFVLLVRFIIKKVKSGKKSNDVPVQQVTEKPETPENISQNEDKK